jgi:hypothetical protein
MLRYAGHMCMERRECHLFCTVTLRVIVLDSSSYPACFIKDFRTIYFTLSAYSVLLID